MKILWQKKDVKEAKPNLFSTKKPNTKKQPTIFLCPFLA